MTYRGVKFRVYKKGRYWFWEPSSVLRGFYKTYLPHSTKASATREAKARVDEIQGMRIDRALSFRNPRWISARAVRIVKRGGRRLLQILVPRRRKRS